MTTLGSVYPGGEYYQPTDASSVIDGSNSVIDGGIPAEQNIDRANQPAAGSPGGNAVEPPGPAEDNSTSTDRPATDSSVLNIELPGEAKVFINDKLTKTQGTRRSYRSPNLKLGQEYKYRVKAVLVRDGKELVQTRLVTMKPGLDETVQFEFDTVDAEELPAPLTTLALNVPANAKVTLCGNETTHRGENRTFITTSLKRGKVWKDYHVAVEFERDGKLLKEERTLNMVAGETYRLSIGIDGSKPDRVALK